MADLIRHLREQRLNGPITLGGHSSGGGFAIRFAGGGQAAPISSYLLLAPAIPTSPAMRQGTAGGWASLNFRRLYGLLALNAIGIHGFNGLPVIEFNKPPSSGTAPRRCRTPTGSTSPTIRATDIRTIFVLSAGRRWS